MHQLQRSGPCLNIKTVFPGYGDSNVKDKTVVRRSYLYNGVPYTAKTVLLYLDEPQFFLNTVPAIYPSVTPVWVLWNLHSHFLRQIYFRLYKSFSLKLSYHHVIPYNILSPSSSPRQLLSYHDCASHYCIITINFYHHHFTYITVKVSFPQ